MASDILLLPGVMPAPQRLCRWALTCWVLVILTIGARDVVGPRPLDARGRRRRRRRSGRELGDVELSRAIVRGGAHDGLPRAVEGSRRGVARGCVRRRRIGTRLRSARHPALSLLGASGAGVRRSVDDTPALARGHRARKGSDFDRRADACLGPSEATVGGGYPRRDDNGAGSVGPRGSHEGQA